MKAVDSTLLSELHEPAVQGALCRDFGRRFRTRPASRTDLGRAGGLEWAAGLTDGSVFDRVARNAPRTAHPTKAPTATLITANHGFRSFEHYRLRVLLHAGGITWPERPRPPRVRTRSPHSDA